MKRSAFPYDFFLFLITVILVQNHLFAQESKVLIRAEIDTTSILIGDQVNIWLNLEQPENKHLVSPRIADSIAGKIEVLKVSPADTFYHKNQTLKIRQRILVTVFDTGFFVIPSFRYFDPVTHDSLKSNALPLNVFDIKVDTTKGITDIKMPYDIPFGFRDLWPYLLIVLLIGLGIALFLYMRNKRKTAPEPEKKFIPPAMPAHVWALQELDKLAEEKLWQKEKIKLYYSRLTDILRRYLELRFSVPAMEKTTFEIILDLRKRMPFSTEWIDQMQQHLQQADMVKFAKWKPEPADHEEILKWAYDFVLHTKRKINLREDDAEKEQNQVDDNETEHRVSINSEGKDE
ncbi:MAG: hypothetical protein J7L89_02575 [Bacteroidales bacterium]|nr:hypothetical protein [Bacteroidales bacterium]